MVGPVELFGRWGLNILRGGKQGLLTILRILGLMVLLRIFLLLSGLGMTIMNL